MPKPVIWHSCCVHFGSLGDHRSIQGSWEHNEEDLGVAGLDFCRFWEDFGTAIWELSADFGTQIVFFGMRVCGSRFLVILDSESGCLGLQNQGFGVGSVAETSFSHMLGFR